MFYLFYFTGVRYISGYIFRATYVSKFVLVLYILSLHKMLNKLNDFELKVKYINSVPVGYLQGYNPQQHHEYVSEAVCHHGRRPRYNQAVLPRRR